MASETTENDGAEVTARLSEPWQAFVELTDQHRPALFSFGLRLSGNPFDGEDLVQDAIIRAFGAAAVQHDGVGNLRAYLFRTMSNLWIDQQRRASAVLMGELEALVAARADGPVDDGGVYGPELLDASRRLFAELAPRERVAVVLHEAFEFRHGEIAEMLATTEGAIRSALHRANKRLGSGGPAAVRGASSSAVDRGVIDAFVSAFRAADVGALRSLLIDDVEPKVFPYPVGRGLDHAIAEGWVRGSLYHHEPDLEQSETPYRSELRVVEIDGVVIVAVDRDGDDGMLLEEVWRLEIDDGAVTSIQDYCFCPEVTAYVADALGAPYRRLGYRFEL